MSKFARDWFSDCLPREASVNTESPFIVRAVVDLVRVFQLVRREEISDPAESDERIGYVGEDEREEYEWRADDVEELERGEDDRGVECVAAQCVSDLRKYENQCRLVLRRTHLRMIARKRRLG